MATTRRSFAAALVRMASLAPAAAALLPARAPRAETAATLPGPAELPALIRRAAEPFARSCRARAAVEGSLGRLDAAAAADHLRGRRGVLVNIAGAEAVAWEEDGSEVLRTRVIVGAARTPTPRLASPVPSIRLNPPWYVPRSIEPEIRAPEASGYRRLAGGRLMLPPGPRNPLGPVRIGLEDSQGVFLHGTSEPGLFARAGRTLSHGCVRVERAVELAAWMLDWTPEALRAVIATGRTIELVPPREVRVVLAYLTAWPVADGRGGAMLELRADPYRLDRGCPADPGAGARRAASG